MISCSPRDSPIATLGHERSMRFRGVPTVRRGPDRERAAYSEREALAKRALLARLNADRVANGLKPLAYDLLAAKAGDAFCLESATSGASGHWDIKGRAPYVYWAEAGGVDYHSQNFAGVTRSGGTIEDDVEGLLLGAHDRMMKERPPDDGHRRTILDPRFTHVGFGVAIVGPRFRMTQEFTRHVMEWVEIPAGPLPKGSIAPFSAKLPDGYELSGVEIAFERPPTPIPLEEIARRSSYSYPPAIRTLSPFAPPGFTWTSGERGDFGVSPAGVFRLDVPLDHGAGNYLVLVYAGEGKISGRALTSTTSALIRAE